ncbi:MAG: hypothetical protein Q9172_005357 [Xanthocarpia lactea]
MERSSSDHATPKPQTIVLNVLSPSTEEVPKKLTFSDIPISTTVRALKERIQNTVPARPPLLRQRLIYQGKVLASDEITLKDVFGQEAPIQQGAPAAASTVRQGPAQTPPGPNMQPLLFPPPQMPGQQGQVPMPPHLQNALNSHLAAMNQQFAAHFAAQGQQHHLHQGPPHTHFQTHQWQQPLLPQASFQQIIAQQQQNRAAAGQYGVSQNPPGNQIVAEQEGQGSDNVQPSNHNPNPDTVMRENQGPNGESFRMVIQSTSFSRPSSGMSQRPHSRASSHTPLRPSTPTNPGFHPPPDTAVSGTPATGNPLHNPRVNFRSPDPLAHFQQGLSAIETSLAGGTAPPQSVFDRARIYLNLMASQPNILPQGLEASLRTRLDNLSTQADHLRASLNSVLSQVLANQQSGSGMAQASGPQGLSSSVTGNTQTGQPLAQDGPSPNRGSQATPSGVAPTWIERSDLQNTNQTSPAPEVYLLSSPLGPHSLLVHPSGLYTTGLTLPLMPGIPHFQPPYFNPFPLPQVNPSHQAPHTPLNPQAPQNPPNQPAGVPAPMHLAQAQQQQQQQAQAQAQAQAQNQPRDLARILLPLGGHLWLLIRLFGFVYFFTAGGGNRRAFLLGICAFIVFIANTGALRPLFRALWDPIRRHIEGLVPLAAAGGGGGGAGDVDQQRQRRQQPQQQQQGRIEDGTDHHRNGALAGVEARTNNTANNRPDPQVLADRLLRDQVNASLFRRAERAIALFVVSLVPGVGERHIAARDAAEARRLEEERQREAREAEEQVADEESDVAESEMERSEGERVRSGSLDGSNSTGRERALHSSGEESGGDREGMRQRDPQEGPPLVDV